MNYHTTLLTSRSSNAVEIEEELGICEQHGEQLINMDWDDETN
jgi:hypothetical protein